MNIENLSEGQVIKNYKELCLLLNEPIKSGKSKNLQLDDWLRYFEYARQGNKYIIEKIYKEPITKEDKRGNGNNKGKYREYKNFNIIEDDFNRIGIYKITLNNDIYIGSTIKSFRKRFQEHNVGSDKFMQHTYEILQNGGVFEILYNMTGIDDEPLIRMTEDMFIKEFLMNTNWNVINRKNDANSYTEKKDKEKLIKFKVKESEYYDVIQMLVEKNLITIDDIE